jgi:hypothetical protein
MNIAFYCFIIAVAGVMASAFAVLMISAIHMRIGSRLLLIKKD